MAEPTKKRGKTLLQSMTVFCALLMLMAYFGADYMGVSEDVRQGILVFGTAAVAIFMRRGIGGRKPMWRSMTVVSAILMTAGYVWAERTGASPRIKDAIFLVGATFIIIYMRRAMMGVYGDQPPRAQGV